MDDGWNTGNMEGEKKKKKKKVGYLLCDRCKRFVFVIVCPVAQP
jgi:hypothetical protein